MRNTQWCMDVCGFFELVRISNIPDEEAAIDTTGEKAGGVWAEVDGVDSGGVKEAILFQTECWVLRNFVDIQVADADIVAASSSEVSEIGRDGDSGDSTRVAAFGLG